MRNPIVSLAEPTMSAYAIMMIWTMYSLIIGDKADRLIGVKFTLESTAATNFFYQRFKPPVPLL